MAGKKRFSLRERARSFGYACGGLRVLFQTEHNARIHLAVTIAVVACGVLLRITAGEWIAVALCVGMVLAAEAFNTSIEYLADHVCSDRHEQIKKVKDLAAAGVFVTAVMAVVVGAIIFLPRVAALF